MVNSLDDEEEIKYRKPMNENFIFVLAVSFIFIVATSGTPYSESDNLNITSIPCHKIKGEVILKEIQNDEYLIYVELFMDNNLDGYIVTVSEVTYDSYQVGDTYEQITCDLGWYNMLKDTIKEMLDAGVLENF